MNLQTFSQLLGTILNNISVRLWQRASPVIALVFAVVWCTLPGARAASDPAIVFDSIDGHEWIGEPYGSPTQASVVDFLGHRCLEAKVTQAVGAYGYIRTKRFPLESWRPQFRFAKIDVYVIGARAARLKLEVHGADFDGKIGIPGPKIPAGRWTTVTWPLHRVDRPVGALSIVLDGITGETPTFYLDNLRLVSATGTRAWDSMDGARAWSYSGNTYDWSGQPPGFPGLDLVSSLGADSVPGSEAASLFLQWRFADSGSVRAEVGLTGLALDLTNVNRISFYARASSTETPVGVFLYDGQNGFSPSSVFLPVAHQWHRVTLDLPWPADFDRSHVTELKFFADSLNLVREGTARFDQVEFSAAPLETAASGLHVPLEDFDQRESGLNRFGGGTGAFGGGKDAFGEPNTVPFLASFDTFPAGGANFGRRFEFQTGYDFAGYYSILHGQADAPRFTFDATRFEFLRFKVRAGDAATTFLNLKVELKDPGVGDDKFFHTAFRTVRLSGLAQDTWQQVTLPLDVANRASWTHSKFAPDAARLKELVVVVEHPFNAPQGAFLIDDVEFIDTGVSAQPITPSATDADFLRFVLKENLAYFLNEVHPDTGLVLDRSSFSDLAGIAATAFGLTAWPIAAKENIISRDKAFAFARRALKTLADGPMSTFDGGAVPVSGTMGVEGFFYRYLDSATGLRKVTLGSTAPDASPVDTALLVWGARACEGAMTVANGYTAAQQREIHTLVRRICDRVNWPVFLVKDGDKTRMLGGWKPESEGNYTIPFPKGGFAPAQGRTWNYHTDEVVLIALAGMSAADPARRLGPEFLQSWQRDTRTFLTRTLVQSYFGALFAHQFAGLWIPLKDKPADFGGTNLYASNLAAHMANLDFSRHSDVTSRFTTFRQNPAYLTAPALLTAHEDPDGRYAGARGAPPNGADRVSSTDEQRINRALNPPPKAAAEPNPINGVVAPYAAGAAFYYIPGEATAILRHYYFDLGLWEPLRGFPDCFTLDAREFLLAESELAEVSQLPGETLGEKERRIAQFQRLSAVSGNVAGRRAVQHVQFGIDQGPMVISLANHLDDNIVHDWATASGDVVRALAMAFPAAKPIGRFTGLVSVAASPEYRASGAIDLTIASGRAFSGRLIWAGVTYKFKGTFEFDVLGGHAAVTIPRSGRPALTLALVLNPDGAPGTIGGTVTEGSTTVPLALVAGSLTAASTHPDAGAYTAFIDAPALPPGGAGFALVNVSNAATARVAGRMPDGAAFTVGGMVRGDGSIVLNAPLYSATARGVLSGTLAFRTVSGVGDLTGDLAWVKPPQPGGLYPDGFAGTARLEAARYSPPLAGQPVLAVSSTAPNLAITLSEGGLAAPLHYVATLDARNAIRLVPPNPERLSLRFTPATGLVTGTFFLPGSARAKPIIGVIQLGQQRGRAFFVTPAATGALSLEPAP